MTSLTVLPYPANLRALPTKPPSLVFSLFFCK